ncbi:MAG: hypothetical protein ABSE75_11525, partial [Acidimicrobiales bacterium]
PDRSIKIHGLMELTLFVSFVGFTTLFFWILRARYRLEVRRETASSVTLDEALEARRREGALQ